MKYKKTPSKSSLFIIASNSTGLGLFAIKCIILTPKFPLKYLVFSWPSQSLRAKENVQQKCRIPLCQWNRVSGHELRRQMRQKSAIIRMAQGKRTFAIIKNPDFYIICI